MVRVCRVGLRLIKGRPKRKETKRTREEMMKLKLSNQTPNSGVLLLMCTCYCGTKDGDTRARTPRRTGLDWTQARLGYALVGFINGGRWLVYLWPGSGGVAVYTYILVCLHLRGVFGFRARSTAFFYICFSKGKPSDHLFFYNTSCLFCFFLASSTAGMDMILIMFFPLCTLPSHAKARFFFFFTWQHKARFDGQICHKTRQDETRRDVG